MDKLRSQLALSIQKKKEDEEKAPKNEEIQ